MSEHYKCIICGEYLEGTEEHIIPKSLGNQTLKIHCVCKSCNSNLGNHIDNYFTNHRLIQIIRQNLGLKGQSGQIPNPFKEGKDKDGRLIRVNEKFEPSTVPTVEMNNGKMRVSASNIEEAKKIAEKKLKRIGMPEDKIQVTLNSIKNQETVEWQPEIEFDATVDFNLFFLEALKIAYEYACYKLGDKYCWQDKTAEKIRKILYLSSKGDYSVKYDKVGLMPDLKSDALKVAANIKCHLVFIHSDMANQLIVNMILFMSPAFSFSVCVSEKADNYSDELENNDMDIIDIQN